MTEYYAYLLRYRMYAAGDVRASYVIQNPHARDDLNVWYSPAFHPVLLYVQKCLKKIIVDRHLLNYLDECNILQFKSVFAGEFGDIMYV